MKTNITSAFFLLLFSCSNEKVEPRVKQEEPNAIETQMKVDSLQLPPPPVSKPRNNESIYHHSLDTLSYKYDYSYTF